MTADSQQAIDLDAKLDELLRLPPAQRLELGERLIESVPPFASPEIEAAWGEEIARRVREIEEGSEPGIPAEDVFREARRRLNDARQVPPSRQGRDD